MPNTGTQKKTKYIHDWNEGVGGTRCAVDGDDTSWESVASNIVGKGGYILCAWTDGHVWESDKPNMYLEFLNMGPLKKKKRGKKTVAQKTPAATTKKPAAKKPAAMTTPVKKLAMKNQKTPTPPKATDKKKKNKLSGKARNLEHCRVYKAAVTKASQQGLDYEAAKEKAREVVKAHMAAMGGK